MKQFKSILILVILNVVFCQVIFCQKDDVETGRKDDVETGRKNDKDTSEKASLVQQILQQLADSLLKPKVIPTEKKARIAYEFKQARLYPSNDALELIHILNPWLDTVQSEIPAQRDLRMPRFPWISHQQRKALREKLKIDSKPDPQTNSQFDSLAIAFDAVVPVFSESYKHSTGKSKAGYGTGPRSFYDTLVIFKKRILPALKLKLPQLCKAKVQYLNSNLAELVNTLSDSANMNDNSISYASNIVRDFFATADFSNTYFKKRNNGFNFSDALYVTTGNNNFLREVKFPAGNSIETKVIKCHLYVYDRKGKPIDNRFDVFLAPYITVFNLENCSDTVAYLQSKSATWDAGPACTATATLCNNANWAVYCRDKRTSRTYLVNQEYNYQNIIDRDDDDNSFFKICIIFHGE